MSRVSFDVAIIGAGIAGLTAAHQAAMSGCAVAVFTDTELPGGLVANVGILEGFPSVGPASGGELAQHLLQGNSSLGVELLSSAVDGVVHDRNSLVVCSGERRWSARQVIVASGAQLKTLDVPGADRFSGRGVLQCAWCNAGLFRARDVVVVGGGDSALQEALHLANFAASVTIIARGEQLRARSTYVGRVSDTENISFRWNSDVLEVLGDSTLTGIRIADRTGGQSEDIPCDGVFVYIGLTAKTEWLADLVERDDRGFIRTSSSLETRTPGLYAVGAARSGFAGPLTSAVGDATEAAFRAVAVIANT